MPCISSLSSLGWLFLLGLFSVTWLCLLTDTCVLAEAQVDVKETS